MNKKPFSLTLAITAITFLAVGTSSAHRLWILPSTTILSGENQWVSVEAAVSNDLFFPNHHALPLERITALSPTGKNVELKSAAEGEIRTSFELLLEEQGTYRIVSEMNGMFASWTENREPKRLRSNAEQLGEMDLSKMEGLKLFKSNTRVESVITCGEATPLKPTGKGLEFDFISHPNDLFEGETSTFKVMLNGKPAAGQEVTIVKGNDRFRNSVDELIVTSSEEGIIEVEWSQPGRYWLNSSADLEAGEFKGVPMKRGASYTLIVEVLPE